MFDLIWETSAASAAHLNLFLREAIVPSEKRLKSRKYGELYIQEIIGNAFHKPHKYHKNAIVDSTKQNKRIDAKILIKTYL